MLNKESIEKKLTELGVDLPKIMFYDCVDSTNTRAKEYAKEHPDERCPVVFIANQQTSGRGRLGRSFVSNENAGIYISILTFPDKNGADATKSTTRAAVLLSKSIEEVCNCHIKIKWVNDLYLNDKKLAGILTEGEMSNSGKIDYQVVGMGINVYRNAISEEISDIATSIEGEEILPPNRADLAALIIKNFLYDESDCYVEYKDRSLIISKNVTVVKLTESYPAKVLDINPDYSLKIQTENGIENLFTGEISIRI